MPLRQPHSRVDLEPRAAHLRPPGAAPRQLRQARDGQAAPNTSRGRNRANRILHAATQLFLKHGYAATSIDAILKLSGGSKATLYEYFSSKDDLFRAVVDEVLSVDAPATLDARGDRRKALAGFLVQRLEVALSARHRALLRLLIAEAERFPDLAQMYYERGPLRSRRMIAQFLSGVEQPQALEPNTAKEVAGFLMGVVAHEWIFEGLLLDGGQLPAAAIRERADRVVDRFLTELPEQESTTRDIP